MIYKSIKIKEGMFERVIDFSSGVNLVFSHKNSKGKTTLLRFLLYSLGYNIPNTRKIKFDRCEVEAIIHCDNIGDIKLCRHNYNQIEVSINEELQTYILPDQLYDLHKIIFGTTNKDLLNNILGAIYADQEKGWTLLNRGTAIGSIRFNIEELIRGLSGCDCSDLIKKEAQLAKELSKYRQMSSIAKYRESVISESGDLIADDYETETASIIAQLLMRQKTLQTELKRVEKNIADNKRVKTYIGEMKLMVLAPDGETIIPVTEDNIVGLSDTLDFLITKRRMIAGELQQVMHKLSSLQKESEAEGEQLSFLQSESMIDIFDKKIASVPMNAVAIEREIKRLEKALKAVRQEISAKTKSDSGIIKSLYDNMVRFATALDVGNSETIANSYLFTSNLKELSGAVLHKTVFAFRLAYIIEIQKKLGIKLPIILDSPSGKEVDPDNIQLMMDILKTEFSDNQIIIASIFKYDFDTVNVIEIKNRLIEAE